MLSRKLAIAALALPFLAGCISDEKIGSPPAAAGGAMFSNYMALGTSIGAGIQSGGINDSTQKQAYPTLLATAMGLTPGVNWFYPSFNAPGCPPPYTNPLTGARVGSGTSTTCAVENPAYARPYQNNLGVPSIRAAQVLKITDLTFAKTDSLFLAQFITGGRNPIDIVLAAKPTFVTIEIGANDVLGAGTRSDTTLLTTLANFQKQDSVIMDSVALTGAKVAVANLPAWQAIPYFTQGVVFFCLATGAPGCPVPATAPYSLPTFTVDLSCAPSASGGVGDSMLVTFPATAAMTGALAAGATASLNCGTGVALANGAAAGLTLVKPKMKALVTRFNAINAFIAAQATARGWALADLNAAYLTALGTGKIASFPDFTHPTTTLFGADISLDGIHPNAAGAKLIANTFIAAINSKYGSSLVAIP